MIPIPIDLDSFLPMGETHLKIIFIYKNSNLKHSLDFENFESDLLSYSKSSNVILSPIRHPHHRSTTLNGENTFFLLGLSYKFLHLLASWQPPGIESSSSPAKTPAFLHQAIWLSGYLTIQKVQFDEDCPDFQAPCHGFPYMKSWVYYEVLGRARTKLGPVRWASGLLDIESGFRPVPNLIEPGLDLKIELIYFLDRARPKPNPPVR